MLYEDRVARFRWNVPSGFNFAWDLIDAWAEDRGRVALYWADEAGHEIRLTFWDVAERSRRFANALRGLGIGRGDPVVIVVSSVPQWPVAFLAVMRLGAIVVPCPAGLSARDFVFRASLGGARAVVAGEDATSGIDAMRGDCPSLEAFVAVGEKIPAGWLGFDDLLAVSSSRLEPVRTRCEEPALCFYVSRTTGGPKAVLHGHGYTWAHRYTGEYWLDLRPTDLHWTTADPGRAAGVYGSLLAPWALGVPVFLYSGRLEPELELELLGRYGVTTFCATPAEYRLLAGLSSLRGELARLRHCVSGEGALADAIVHAWRDVTGLTIHEGYGRTETALLVANVKGLPVRPGSAGKPFPGHDVRIVDAEGSELPPGQIGDIALRGRPPSLFLGYWKDPEETSACRRGEWYVTGDRAYRDEQGYFWRVGGAGTGGGVGERGGGRPDDHDAPDLDRVRRGA